MSQKNATELVKVIKRDMLQAMKSGERTKTDALKSLLARISNAEAVTHKNRALSSGPIAGAVKGVGNSEAQRKTLSMKEVRSIILAEKEEMEAALFRIDQMAPYGAELQRKIAAIEKYIS